MQRFSKWAVAVTAAWALIFSPAALAFAEVSRPGASGGTVSGGTGGQYERYNQGATPSNPAEGVAGGIAGAAGQCVFGSMISQLLSQFITYLLGQILGTIGFEAAEGVFRVPTQTNPSTRNNIKNQVSKEVCAWAPWGYCVLPSLDSIAFCIINEIIHYISQATIKWIKSGFQGSPAFIEDPGRFFQDAGDQIAGNILNQISGGLLCEPWRAQIQIRLLNERVGTFGSGGARGCALSEVDERWESFAENGNFFSWDLQYAYTQNPFNNPIGSYIEARNAFNLSVAQAENGLQVQMGWSDGFLHVKDPETGRITTPGRVLENQINRRLGTADQRLLIADEFDEVMNTLVNQLIKIALSEMLGGGESDDGGDRVIDRFDFGRSGSVDVIEDPDGGGGTTPTDPDGGTDGIGTDLTVSCLVEDPTILEGQTATVTAKVSGSVGSIRYDWDKDFTGANATSTKKLKDEGTYTARITVSDKDWDKETATATCEPIKVSEDFKVTCTVDKPRIEPGERVLYTAEVTGNDGEVVGYTWRGSAGGSGKSISKRYTVSGIYDQRVEVVDKEGNREEVECPRVTAAR